MVPLIESHSEQPNWHFNNSETRHPAAIGAVAILIAVIMPQTAVPLGRLNDWVPCDPCIGEQARFSRLLHFTQ